jgi:hypothetical protein
VAEWDVYPEYPLLAFDIVHGDQYGEDYYRVCRTTDGATTAKANAALIAKAPQLLEALQNLITAAEALADQEEATLSLDETRGNQKKVTPANLFLSVGRSDIRDAIAEARALLED